MRHTCTLFTLLIFTATWGQSTLTGKVISSKGKAVDYALIGSKSINSSTRTDENGKFQLQINANNPIQLQVKAIGFQKWDSIISPNENKKLTIVLQSKLQEVEEVVVSGNLREVSKTESTIAVEVFTPEFLKANPTSNIFEALQTINGVRPQLNCNICNTGDIHINGLEGPYTMVLIDGMPIVSNLASVYGLSGIPNSLIERIEIVKGPASSLYGSEAIGGVINIITKTGKSSPTFSADVRSNTWLETNVDLGFSKTFNDKVNWISGINYFNYQNPVDNNGDNFTDVTLQHRISLFQKLQFKRKDYKLFSIAGRYFYEDRWGGEMDWSNKFRGGDSIYGESIYTNRWEVIGAYELPIKERVIVSLSANNHQQNSFYGNMPFMAEQTTVFGQVVWYKDILNHNLLVGLATRYVNYDDDTPATLSEDSTRNMPFKQVLPGLFIQDEWKISGSHKLLGGIRYDYDTYHGNIFTPRVGYKFTKNNHLFRINAGNGFRVVNVFTEDHAALTGARKVIIKDELQPEKSYNGSFNYYWSKVNKKNNRFVVDATVFYTYFTNKIFPDYESNQEQIIYSNLQGYSESKGISLNLEGQWKSGTHIRVGGTLMDVSNTENGITERQMLTEYFTGTWTISQSLKQLHLKIDYTGNVYSPMRLPVLNDMDPRSEYSPWWSVQNVQLTFTGIKNFEFYGGVKNLLNWTPGLSEPFIIANADDPFDKQVATNENGEVVPSPNNPNALTFDPSYVYGPNQGVRTFLGIRYNLPK